MQFSKNLWYTHIQPTYQSYAQVLNQRGEGLMNELHALVIAAEKFYFFSFFFSSPSVGRSEQRVSYRKTPQELMELLSRGQWGGLDSCQHVRLLTGFIYRQIVSRTMTDSKLWRKKKSKKPHQTFPKLKWISHKIGFFFFRQHFRPLIEIVGWKPALVQ